MNRADRHQPARPAGWCRACGEPYPCRWRRVELLVTYGRSPELAIHAVRMLEQAARDMPDLPPAELWDRFVAWTQPVGVR